MRNFEQTDFYTDASLIENPYPFFEYLRSQGPIVHLPGRNVVGVTGFKETLEIINDPKTFSSVLAPTGPIPELPFEPEGDDITEQLAAHREEIVASGMIVTKDGIEHTNHRSLLNRLFTPTRLKENEKYLGALVDKMLDEVIDQGEMNLIKDVATPFATLVIADLLGVPETDRETFREQLATTPATVGEDISYEHSQAMGLGFLFEYFENYIEERRDSPKKDIFSEFATSKFPDGSTPEVEDLVWIAAFLFAAGQDTTARLLGTSLKVLCENPELQEKLRNDRSLIANFIDEAIRYDGPVKSTHRLVVKTTEVAGVKLKAGTIVALFLGAANRDPRQVDDPNEFKLGRPKANQHIGFGRGAHTCIGMPLAKAEVTACLNRILDRLGNIHLSEKHHGKPGNRKFTYEAISILRALKDLHIEFTPIKS